MEPLTKKNDLIVCLFICVTLMMTKHYTFVEKYLNTIVIFFSLYMVRKIRKNLFGHLKFSILRSIDFLFAGSLIYREKISVQLFAFAVLFNIFLKV